MRLVISLSHLLLSISLKEFLCAVIPSGFEVIIDGYEQLPESVDIVVVDYPCLISQKPSSRFPGAKILLMDTRLSIEEKRLAVVFFNARGIIAADSSPELFLKALQKVRKGELWLDHKTAEELLVLSRDGSINKKIKGLTMREQQLIPLVCKGYSNKEIAKKIGISVSTVKTLLSKTFRKFGVSNRSQLLAIVMESGVLERLNNNAAL